MGIDLETGGFRIDSGYDGNSRTANAEVVAGSLDADLYAEAFDAEAYVGFKEDISFQYADGFDSLFWGFMENGKSSENAAIDAYAHFIRLGTLSARIPVTKGAVTLVNN